jgi:hypothetical protein
MPAEISRGAQASITSAIGMSQRALAIAEATPGAPLSGSKFSLRRPATNQ